MRFMMGKQRNRAGGLPFPERYLTARLPRYTSYPTADRFTPLTPAHHRLWLASLPAEEAVSLYIHLPFCPKLCWYCGCHTTITTQPGRIDRYLDDLITEIASVARLIGRRQRVLRLHLGGGTPNALTLSQLSRLFQAIAVHFDLGSAQEIAAELDPRLVTRAQAAHLASLGVNRVSLGVQDFDATVQEAINRIQPRAMVEEAAALLRSAGIVRIGFDLMYGLPHQTVDSVRRSARTAAAIAPRRIATFGYAHVPWMKRHQRLIAEHALPDPRARWAQMQAIAEELQDAGYQPIGFDHFALAHDSLALAQAQGRLTRNFQGFTDDRAQTLIGLGASAISTFTQGYVQNAPRLDAYRARLRDEGLATSRGIALLPEDRLRRAAINELLCYGETDLACLALSHGVGADALDDALCGLEVLAQDGLIELHGRRVRIPPKLRPLARWAAAAMDPQMAPLFGEGRGAAPQRHALAV